MNSLTMPKDIKELMEPLRIETIFLHEAWKIFEQLYFDRGKAELAYRSANNFFVFVARAAVDSMLSAVARLGDPPSTCNRENLSLSYLVETVEKVVPPEVKREMRRHLSAFDNASEPVREWRNKMLAHKDLRAALGEGLLPSGVTPETMRDVLSEITAILNVIDMYYGEGEWKYDQVILDGDGDTVIELLKKAEAHKECIRAKMRGGGNPDSR
jgi:hypothetical protein